MTPIPDAPGYFADPHGMVWTDRGRKLCRLRRYIDGHSVWCVTIRDADGNRRLFVPAHQLVAAAFLGPRPEGHCAAHKGPRWDDRPGNLAWVPGEPPSGNGFCLDAATEDALVADLTGGATVLSAMSATGLPALVVTSYAAALAGEAQGAPGRPRVDPAVSRRVAGLLAAGWSDSAIAREVGTSARTVGRLRRAASPPVRPAHPGRNLHRPGTGWKDLDRDCSRDRMADDAS